MKLRLIAVAMAALFLTTGNAVAQDTSSEKGKLSYALGYDLGRNAVESGEPVDVNTITDPLRSPAPPAPTAVVENAGSLARRSVACAVSRVFEEVDLPIEPAEACLPDSQALAHR